MTKPWDDVREEIVRLISTGASLEQVRAILSRERKFDASIRSYRKKLKQWRLTRIGQFDVQRASGNTTGTGMRGFPYAEDSDNKVAYDSIGEESCRRQPLPEDSAITDSPHQRQAPSHRLHAAFGDLERALDGPEMFKVLDRIRSQFQAGTETILHYAAARSNFWVLDCILDYMQSEEIDIDMVDGEGRTALETAIEFTQRENIDSLVRARANLKRRSQRIAHQGQPLHLAVSTTWSAEICRVLISAGAPINARQHNDDSCRHTPLRLAVSRAVELRMGTERDTVSAIIEVLLENDAKLGADCDGHVGDLPVLKFLHSWTSENVPKTFGFTSRGFYLGHYFRTGCSPLCWFPARWCRECHSFASYVFAHTHSNLGALLIASSDMAEYGERLAERIVAPCQARPYDDLESSSILLWNLLSKSARESNRSNWDHKLVKRVLDDSPQLEKVRLVKTLLESNVGLNSDPTATLISLSRIDETPRLQLAEILLVPEMGIVRETLYADFMRHYLDYLDSTSDPSNITPDMYPGFASALLEDMGLVGTDMSPQEEKNIFQCVVHVLTRYLITSPSPEITERRRIEAFRLRDIYELPPLSISSRFLQGLLFEDGRVAPWLDNSREELQASGNFSRRYADSIALTWRQMDEREARRSDTIYGWGRGARTYELLPDAHMAHGI